MRFFRAVNLPTVPGDVFSGAAVASCGTSAILGFKGVTTAAAAGVLLYMFGLADNDIVGAATDTDRPIPQGLISLRAARIARTLCILGAISLALVTRLHGAWWSTAFALAIVIATYNRTKIPVLMGLCRGLNLVCGFLAAYDHIPANMRTAIIATFIWTAYIAGVTKYSEGEELDPARKRRVGLLIGALVWLQIAATLFPALIFGEWTLLIAQLVMIVLLFLFKSLMPKVSAS